MNSDAWQKWMFRSAFIFTLIVPLVLASRGIEKDTVLVFAGIGIATMVLTRLQDIVSFKAFGLEAQLQSKIDEANATIKQLQGLAIAISQPIITNLGIQGHFVELKYADRYNMREGINDLLSSIGIPEGTVSVVNSAFNQMFRKLLVAKILSAIVESEELHIRAEEMRERDDVVTSSEINAFLQKAGLLTDERKEYLDELRHFESTGALKNTAILDRKL